MKYEIHPTTRYRDSLKKLLKSGRFSKEDSVRLNDLIEILADDGSLEEKYRDHALRGYKVNMREFHFRPDLLVRYAKIESVLILSIRRDRKS